MLHMRFPGKRHRWIVWLCSSALLGACLAGGSSAACGQALPGAVRPIEAQAGVGFSFTKPDFASLYASAGFPYIKGFTAYADATYHHRFGLEADVHYDSILTPADIGENTYMVGPRIVIFHEDRMSLYAKVVGGLAAFQYQKGTYLNPHTDTFGAFAIGGGIDFRASRHITVRGIDIEQQYWPGFSPTGLKPFVTTFGVAYTD